jgi:hypothetical protein
MSQAFTCNGTTTRQALLISPLSAESSTNTDYVAVNNLLVTTAAYFGTQPTARVQIVGDGSTSATTSLLVQNYSGTESLKVLDDGAVAIGGNTTIAKANLQITSGFSGSLNFTTINFANWNGTIYGVMSGIDASNSNFIFGGTTINASAKVQFDSTTQGFLPPRMTDTQRAAIASPAEGLMLFNTDNKGVAYRDGTNWGYLSAALQNATGSGGTLNILFASGNVVNLTLNASTTLTFSGHVVGTYIIQVTQGGTGSNTLTYPASVKWSGGTPPTLTTAVGKTDILTFYHDGTSFFGTYSLNY